MTASPEGTAEILAAPTGCQATQSTVPSGLAHFRPRPGVETPGYSHDVPSGQGAKTILRLWKVAFASGVLLLAGCTSAPHTPSAQVAPASAPAAVSSLPPRLSPNELLSRAAAQPSAPFDGADWQPMDDGKSLTGWRETDFAGHGEVRCQSGLLVLDTGDPFTGIKWTNDFPKRNYEVALDAMRVSGSDFFCGLTVPVGDSFCTLIVGGWGGSLVGVSSLDSQDASENETTKFSDFTTGRWYRIRLRVTESRIEGWIDQDKLVDVVTTGKRISLRPGDIELSKPFGIAAWETSSALREIKIRRVNGPADPKKGP